MTLTVQTLAAVAMTGALTRGKDWLVSSVEIQKVNNSEPPSWYYSCGQLWPDNYSNTLSPLQMPPIIFFGRQGAAYAESMLKRMMGVYAAVAGRSSPK